MAGAHSEVETVSAPPLAAAGVGGYGSTIVARPGTDEVIFSRHLGTPRVRWLRYRLAPREFSEGKGLAGDLRDAVFGRDDAWLLGTYGLCRVSLEPLGVLDVVTERIGKYKDRLFELSSNYLGVAAAEGRTVTVVASDSGKVVKALRVAAPDLVLRDRGVTRLCAFHARVARDLHVDELRLGAQAELPHATAPLVVGDVVVALAGPVAPYGRVIDTERVVADAIMDVFGPVGRLARRVLRVPSSESPLGFAIRPERFLELDAGDLSVRRSVDGAAGLRALIGVDSRGRIVATADRGLALVDADRLEIVDRFEHEAVAGPACWVPEAQTAVVLRHYLVDPRPRGFDPVPEKLVLVRW